MATVKEIYHALDRLAPFEAQLPGDNAGFLVGRTDAAVKKVLISLDITEEVVHEAAAVGAQLIVSHHPVLFHAAKELTDANPTGRILLSLAEQRIAAICAHTNLDLAVGGVNDTLAARLGLTDVSTFEPEALGRAGTLPAPVPFVNFAAFVKEALGANGVRYVDCGKPARRVAVGGGACGDYISAAHAFGCDTFVTSDVKYHGFLEAKALGINLIDAGHFPTENPVCAVLADWLRKGFPDIETIRSTHHKEVISSL